MRTAGIVVLCFASAWCGSGRAAEQAWEVRGEFTGLKPGAADVAVFRLPDGSRLEVPLQALSDGSRTAIEKRVAAKAKPAAGEGATKPGDDKTQKPAIADALKEVEADAGACRMAVDAVTVYRLFLSRDGLAAEDREAAEKRLDHYRSLAAAGKVRSGSGWVAADKHRQSARDAESDVLHSLELLRLGKADLAMAELDKAAREDVTSGAPHFLMGLAFSTVVKDKDGEKATSSFAESMRRDPDNAYSMANLAIWELIGRKHLAAVTHLRQAVEIAPECQPLVDLIGLTLRTMTAGRNKMAEKPLAELNEIYKNLTQELKLKPNEAQTLPMLLTAAGAPWIPPATLTTTAAGPAVAAVPLSDAQAFLTRLRTGLAFAVAPGFLVTDSRLVAGATEISVLNPADKSIKLAAKLVADAPDGGLALLQCDAFAAEPLSLAEGLPAAGAEISVLGIGRGRPFAAGPSAIAGRVLDSPGAAADERTFLFSAPVVRGVSGGPVLDDSGNVIGLVTGTPKGKSVGDERGMAVAAAAIRTFLDEHVPEGKTVEKAGKQAAGLAVQATAPITVKVPPGR